MSKSDFELMIFKFYIENLLSNNRDENNVIKNYNECSDYKISKDLGITPQRVSNLKVKKELVYPSKYDWKKAFLKLTENARYDPVTKKVTINIPDPNLYLEIQNFLEEKGSYIEKQLNRKVMCLRAEYYIDLIISLNDSESERKEITEGLKKSFMKKNKGEFSFDDKNIGKSLIDGAVNISTIAANLSDIAGGVLSGPLRILIKSMI